MLINYLRLDSIQKKAYYFSRLIEQDILIAVVRGRDPELVADIYFLLGLYKKQHEFYIHQN